MKNFPTHHHVISLIIWLSIILGHNSFAQNLHFQGRVTDKQTKNGIPFATVAIFDDDWVRGTYCDSLGYFLSTTLP
jgi:hypothetical protein